MAVSIEVLGSLPYFSGLNRDELDSIRKLVYEKPVDKGKMILFDGESDRTLYFVIAGVVKIFKSSVEGKDQILSIVSPRESFNDVPVFDDGPNYVSAQAMTPVIIYGIDQANVRIILRNHPQVAMNVAKALASQMRHLISLIEDLSFKNVLGRVAKILLDSGDGSRPRLTQQDMAAMAGTAREMVGRSLKALENDGIIRFDRNRIIVANKKALQEIAGVIT